MKSKWLMLALAGIAAAPEAIAGPHIGMKLACKRYGEAWRSGSKDALYGVTTDDFAAAWRRLPEDAFRQMPRDTGADLMGTAKSPGIGTVTVDTPNGVITFIVVGRGFRWTVADILRPDEEGLTVSLKDTIHAGCTVREFAEVLGTPRKEELSALTTARFAASIEQAKPSLLARFKKTETAPRKAFPRIRFNGDEANVVVYPKPGDQTTEVTFQLKNEDGWRVDDLRIKAPDKEIVSLRGGLPALQAAADFNAFARDSQSVDPAAFATGELLTELKQASERRDQLPTNLPAVRKRIEVNEGGTRIVVTAPEQTITVYLLSENGTRRIREVEVDQEGKKSLLSELLAMERKTEKVPGGKLLVRVLEILREGGGE